MGLLDQNETTWPQTEGTVEMPPPPRKLLCSGVVVTERKSSLFGQQPLKSLNPRTEPDWPAAQGRWQGKIFVEHAFLFPGWKGTGVASRVQVVVVWGHEKEVSSPFSAELHTSSVNTEGGVCTTWALSGD